MLHLTLAANRGTQLCARVDPAARPAEHLAVQQLAARPQNRRPDPVEALDRLLIQPLGLVALPKLSRGEGDEGEGPVALAWIDTCNPQPTRVRLPYSHRTRRSAGAVLTRSPATNHAY